MAGEAQMGTTSLSTDIRLYSNCDYSRYNKPTQVGHFSTDEEKKFIDDSSSLKYLYKESESDARRSGFDLNVGFEEFEAENVEKEGRCNDIDNLLKWVVAHKDEIKKEDDGDRLWCEFVCWRGLLTRMLTTIYEQKDDWIIAVTLFRGTYYLCEYETEKRYLERTNMLPRQAKMCYWGHKFEQYCVTDKPGSKPDDPTNLISTKQQFCSVVTSKLDNHKLLFGGEVDCCDPADEKRYYELKTNRIFAHAGQEKNFGRYKALKWWAQSFLVGIPKILAGFRDDDGYVKYLKYYQTSDLPKLSGGAWHPGPAFTFTSRLLTFIRDTVKVDDAKVVCVFRYVAENHCVSAQQYPGPSEWTFLPDWYTTMSSEAANTDT